MKHIVFIFLIFIALSLSAAAMEPSLVSPIIFSGEDGRVDFHSTPSIMAFLNNDLSKKPGAVYMPAIWFFEGSVKVVDGIYVIGGVANGQ